MAILANKDMRVALAANSVVGRSFACTFRIDDPRASSEHARLAYREGAWSVRDLGSRNGTYLNGQRIEPRGPHALSKGDELSFGTRETIWTLVDASPPVAMARNLSTDEYIAALTGGMLALPSPEEPLVCVFEDEGGAWILEMEGQSRAAKDGEVLSLGGASFMLHLPVPLAQTADGQERKQGVEGVELRFRVSPNEEAVEVTVVDARGVFPLAPRTHHYTLLTLARARAKDREDPKLLPSQRGWVFVDELCRMLRMDEFRLNTEIYRIRQDMASVGLCNAAALIERRRGSRQLRVVTERVIIDAMA